MRALEDGLDGAVGSPFFSNGARILNHIACQINSAEKDYVEVVYIDFSVRFLPFQSSNLRSSLLLTLYGLYLNLWRSVLFVDSCLPLLRVPMVCFLVVTNLSIALCTV